MFHLNIWFISLHAKNINVSTVANWIQHFFFPLELSNYSQNILWIFILPSQRWSFAQEHLVSELNCQYLLT